MYMSVDGGGTKVQALLFEMDGSLLGFGQGGSINQNFTADEAIRKNMRRCIEGCVSAALKSPKTEPHIKTLYISMPGPCSLFLSLLSEYVPVDEMIVISEGRMGLLGGILSKNGFAALSGTGSDAFIAHNDGVDAVGGWGSLLGDEGSGYDIGRQVLAAAIRAHDGWGADTSLTEKVYEFFNLNALHELVPLIYKSTDSRPIIASCAILAAEAANEGDPVALSIYRSAAEDMAKQTLSIIRRSIVKNREYATYPITVCGGAWKGHAKMFETFAEIINRELPACRLYYPMYDAVVGGVAHMLIDAVCQGEAAVCLNRFYGSYRYPLPLGCSNVRKDFYEWMA